MKTSRIHYFTGTGNTARAVRLISDRLKASGYEVSVVEVHKGYTPSIFPVDLNIVAFPVLSWAAPAMMLQYLRQMPAGNNTPLAVLAVNGATLFKGKITAGYTGQALEQVERMMKRKGYDIQVTANASYPENWTQMTNPCDDETNHLILPEGDRNTLDFCNKVLTGQQSLYRCGFLNKLWSGTIAYLFIHIGRKVLGTMYIADERCNACGLCVQTCPAKTIVMDKDRPRWKTRCEDCNRCINVCPEKAVQVSIPMMLTQIGLNIFMTVWFSSCFMDFFDSLLIGLPLVRILTDVASIVAGIALAAWFNLVPINALFNWLQRSPKIRRYLTNSFTRSFRRYLAPGYKPWKKID